MPVIWPSDGTLPWSAPLKAYIDNATGANAFLIQLVEANQHSIYDDAGATFGSASVGATETSLLTVTAPIFPGSSFQTGDLFQLSAWGTYLNNSGAGRDFTLTTYLDATVVGLVSTGVFAGAVPVNTTTPYVWGFEMRMRVDAAGFSGGISSISTLVVGAAAGVGPNVLSSARSTVVAFDMSGTLVFDFKAKFSNAGTIQVIDCACINLRKIPA